MKTRRFVVALLVLTLISALLPAVASASDKYLASVKEISFSSSDAVAQKAAELMEDKATTEEKAMACYSYIVKNFSYDWDLYNKVVSGRITKYTPDPEDILKNKVGICYDIASLYAAMLRSQGIPCKMVKGYSSAVNGYHAWNAVYDDATDRWITMDLTVDMCNSGKAKTSWASVSGTYRAKSAI